MDRVFFFFFLIKTFKKDFRYEPFFKVFTGFITILLLFYFIYLFIFGYEECGIFAPDQGLNQHALYLKAILTTGLSVNSLGQGLKSTLSEEAREASS